MATAVVKQSLLYTEFILHHIGTIDNTGVKTYGHNIAIVPNISRIAHTHKHQRRMMAVNIGYAPHLELALSLRLQIEAHLIGSTESSIGRTIAVETNMIQPQLLQAAEHTLPRSLIGRHAAPQREIIVDYDSTQINGMAIQKQLAVYYPSLAHAKCGLHVIIASTYSQAVAVGVKLIPEKIPIRNSHLVLHVVSPNIMVRHI